MSTFKRTIFSNLLNIHKSKKKRKTNHNNNNKTLKNPPHKTPNPPEEPIGEGHFSLKSCVSSKTHLIQPLGNLLLLRNQSSNIRDPGLGNLRVLSDELVLDVLGLLEPKDLAFLSIASKSFYVFCFHDPLWRNLVLRDFNGGFVFRGSWRSTYVSVFDLEKSSFSGKLVIRDFYSDYLFQSWLCASLEMKKEWLETDNIQRRGRISVEEFVRDFEELNRPVLLSGCLEDWPALEKWDREYLIRVSGDVRFAVGPVEMMLEDYFQYADSVKEERPLYLFDPRFTDKVPSLGTDYEAPEYFREDLFAVLGSERPDYKWVIVGPQGSGSSFHVDPNSTSAWNAVIRGSKKWVMFPPEVVPPGVYPSPDGAEVACPVSIMEWFMNFYGDCKRWKRRPVECVCKAGEVVFVPNGWWHLVVNLEDSIAITQNYVSRRNLLNVLDFLKKPNATELVSGTTDRVNLYDKFKGAIEASFPGTIDELTHKAREKMELQKKPTFWESVADARVGGFKFSFE